MAFCYVAPLSGVGVIATVAASSVGEAGLAIAHFVIGLRGGPSKGSYYAVARLVEPPLSCGPSQGMSRGPKFDLSSIHVSS
jgi:hypothetical protein